MRAAGASRGAHRSVISFHNFPRRFAGKRVETKPTDNIKRLPLIRLLCRHLPPRGKAGNNNVPAGCLLKSRHCNTAALAKKISQKDFLRRGAASVLSAAFGAAEPPAGCAPTRRCQFKKKKCKPAINHVREQNHAFALRYSICAYLRLRRKSECGAAILLRLRRREKTRGQPQAYPRVVSQSHDFFPRQFAEKSVNYFTPTRSYPWAWG